MDKCYGNHPETIEALKHETEVAIHGIEAQTIENVLKPRRNSQSARSIYFGALSTVTETRVSERLKFLFWMQMFHQNLAENSRKNGKSPKRTKRNEKNRDCRYVCGLREAKRRLVASVVISKLLYAAPVWTSALNNHAIQKNLFSAQRGVVLRIVSAY